MKSNRISKTVRINEEIIFEIEKIALENGEVSFSQIVNIALLQYVKIYKGEKSIEILNEHIIGAMNAIVDEKFKKVNDKMNHVDRNGQLLIDILIDNLDISEVDLTEYKLKMVTNSIDR